MKVYVVVLHSLYICVLKVQTFFMMEMTCCFFKIKQTETPLVGFPPLLPLPSLLSLAPPSLSLSLSLSSGPKLVSGKKRLNIFVLSRCAGRSRTRPCPCQGEGVNFLQTFPAPSPVFVKKFLRLFRTERSFFCCCVFFVESN